MQATNEKGLWKYKTWRCNLCLNTKTELTKIIDDYGAPINLVPPSCCDTPMSVPTTQKSGLSAPIYMRDINPYMTVAADKETGNVEYITSRSQHNAFLKRNNYEEIGNETITPPPREYFKTDGEHLKEAIARTNEVKAILKHQHEG